MNVLWGIYGNMNPSHLRRAEFASSVSFFIFTFLWLKGFLDFSQTSTFCAVIGFVLIQRICASGFKSWMIIPGSLYPKLEYRLPLRGKVCIVTGANTGIGYHTAAQLAKLGAFIIITCRTQETCDKTLKRLSAEVGLGEDAKNAHAIVMELGDLDSVRRAAAAIRAIPNLPGPIYRLVNNAGATVMRKKRTKQGFEPHMGCNFLGPLLFTDLLAPLFAQGQTRVVNLTSYAHRMVREKAIEEGMKRFGCTNNSDDAGEYTVAEAMEIYALSKFGNLAHTQCIAMESTPGAKFEGVESVAVHPGFVASEFARDLPGVQQLNRVGLGFIYPLLGCLFFKLPIEGSYTSVYCCVEKTIVNGWYYADCAAVARGEVSREAKNAALVRKLVDWGRRQIEFAK